MAELKDLKVGTRVRMAAQPENDCPEEEGVIDYIDTPEEFAVFGHPDEGPNALVRVDLEWRAKDCYDDGIREVFFDEEMLARTEVLA